MRCAFLKQNERSTRRPRRLLRVCVRQCYAGGSPQRSANRCKSEAPKVRKPIRAIPHAQLERLRETASVRVCSWNCSCPICSRSAIIEIELDLALGTAKSENILR